MSNSLSHHNSVNNEKDSRPRWRLAKTAMAIGLSAAAAAFSEADPAEATPDIVGPKAIESTTIYEANPAEIVKEVSTKNRVVLINGKPSFLFGVWAPEDDWAVRELGANLLIHAGEHTTPENIAQSVEGRAWVMRYSYPGVANFGNVFSNEIGIAWHDEPENHGYSAQALASTPQNGRLNYQNFTSQIGSSTFGNREAISKYKPYIDNLGANAAVSYDYYVFNEGPAKKDPFLYGVQTQYYFTLATKQATNNPNIPVGTYIETTNWGNRFVPLSSDMVVGSAKAAVTAGATIINYWDRRGDVAPNSTPPETAKKIKQFNNELHQLSPILLAKQMEGIKSPWESPVKLGGRVTTDKNGKQKYHMILFNSTPEPIKIQKKLPKLKNQVVTEATSGKKIKARAGKITTEIEPYGWQIESYQP